MGPYGALTLSRGFPKTHRFTQAKIAFAVVAHRCKEIYSHRYSHMDKYDIKGKKTKIPLDLNFESALTLGEWDIDENWSKSKNEFLKGGANAGHRIYG